MGMTALGMGFVLAITGKLTPEFTFILIAVFGFFSGANVLTTMASIKAGSAPTTDTIAASTRTATTDSVTTTSVATTTTPKET